VGLAQDSQDAVARYEWSAHAAVLGARDLLATVDGLGEHLSDAGPLGLSSDPALARARELLSAARAQLTAAAEAAAASAGTARSYVDRAFPV
jgi:hypothetical protein